MAQVNGGQVIGLYRKQMLLFRRSWFWTFFRAFFLPVAFIVFMGEAKHFFVPYAVYGVSSPYDIRSLRDVVTSDQIIAYFPAEKGDLTQEMHEIMNRALRDVPSSQIHVLDSPEEILSLCKENLRGASKCYGAIEWNSIDDRTKAYNYTLRGNSGLSYINVDNHKSSTDIYVLPLQLAVDTAIAEVSGTSSVLTQYTPQSMPYTRNTNEYYKSKVNRTYMKTLYNWIAPAFFLTMIGVVYHLAGVTAQEQELGIAGLLSCMGIRSVTRFVSYFVSFSTVYFPGWIIIGVALSQELYMASNPAILIFYHILSGFSMVSWSIFLGVFFPAAQPAGIVASGLSVFLAIMTTVQTRVPETGPYKQGAVYALSFIFPPCNYSYFISTISRYQHDSLATNLVKAAPGSNILGIVIFVAAIFQIFFFFGLALIFYKWIYGIPSQDKSDSTNENMSASVSLSNLSKIYNTRKWYNPFNKNVVTAVNDLSLDIGMGQIVCLLGANGSGKTTTLEMIAGVQGSSSGSIRMAQGARIGLCPQKNVLWGDLTVQETIEIWARMKSVGAQDVKRAANQIIRQCDLEPKRRTKAKHLSGGQKRKLQLGIMFVGGSDICCIDEASSGLDPISRRKIWDILLQDRGERTLILTTHFLDEADILADEIAIMSCGQLKVNGPSVKLKHSLGGGFVVHASEVGHKNSEKTILARAQSASEAIAVVQNLEAQNSQYWIKGPSLENVFLNIAHNDHQFLQTHEFANVLGDLNGADTNASTCDESYDASGPASVKYSEVDTTSKNSPELEEKKVAVHEIDKIVDEPKDKTNDPTLNVNLHELEAVHQSRRMSTNIFSQTKAMLRKRFTVFRRAPLAEIVAFLLPIIVAGATRTFVTNFGGTSCSSQNQFDAQKYSTVPVDDLHMVVGPESTFLGSSGGLKAIAASINASIDDFVALLNQNSLYINTTSEFVSSIGREYAEITPGGLLAQPSSPIIAYRIDGSDKGTYTGPIVFNMLNNILLNGTIQLFTNFSPFQSSWANGTGDTLQFVVYFGLAIAVAPAFIGLYATFERLSKVRAMQYSNGLRVVPLWLAYTLFSFVFWVVLSAILTGIIASANSGLYGMGYLFVCFVLYGLGSILVSFLFSLIVQSQLAAFAITAAVQAIYFLVYLIAYLSVLAYGSPLTIPQNLKIVHFVMAIFLPVANIVRALFVAFNLFGVTCHDSSSGGSVQISYPGSLIAYGGPILYMVIQSIVFFALLVFWECGYINEWARYLKPIYSPFQRLFHKKNNSQRPGTNQAALLPSRSGSSASSSLSETYDVDEVSTEASCVSNGEYDSGLKLLNVSKAYGTNRVVDDVSWGVREDECFALLGPNGAGKTTTFDMIRGEVDPTSGNISVNGISSLNRSLARARLGVCPQFDAMDKMTVQEILLFYSQLRGLPNAQEHVDNIISAVGLNRFRMRLAHKLSGGNKRKVSLAVALIGDPPVLLLDEPSSGMDAFAKRIMWQTLSEVAQGKSIVLTTHSMEEADYLASRAGFLARRLLAVGSTDQLRDKYGGYFHLHVILNNAPHSSFEEMESLVEAVETQFEGAYPEDRLYQGQIRIALPASNKSMATILQIVEHHKTLWQISSYIVTETSLEEVFLGIARRYLKDSDKVTDEAT